MTRGEKRAEIDEFHAPLAEAQNVVWLEVDNDDAVFVELGENGEGFVNGFFEFGNPFVRKAFVGGIIAPGLHVVTVEEFHGDVGILLFINDVGAVVDRDEAAEGLEVYDVLEVSEFERKAGVGTESNFVGAIAVAVEVENLDDDVWVVGVVDGGFGGLLEDLRKTDPAQAGEIHPYTGELILHCCCLDWHKKERA